jgi:putative ABC transport system substrate-binding protein
MRRREFTSLLSGAVIAWPCGLMAQDLAKRPLVAVLEGASAASQTTRYRSGFAQGLQELGYVEGQNIDFVYRFAEGDLARIPKLADELVRLMPDVIVCASAPAILAIRQIRRVLVLWRALPGREAK